MLATYVKPLRTVYSRIEAVAAYWDACTDLGMHPSVSLVTVLVAHGALETGNFSACWNNNVGNVKLGSWTGNFTCIVLNEVLKNSATGKHELVWFAPEGELTGDPRKGGKLKPAYLEKPLSVPPGHPQTRMRAYPTLAKGVEDKIRFLLSPHWNPVLKPARVGDASTYGRLIRAHGYFTAYKGDPDPCQYEKDVISLCNTYRPLVIQVANGERPEPTKAGTVDQPAEPVRFTADDAWRQLAFRAYEQAQAMDVHEMVRKEAMRELSGLTPVSSTSNEDEIS